MFKWVNISNKIFIVLHINCILLFIVFIAIWKKNFLMARFAIYVFQLIPMLYYLLQVFIFFHFSNVFLS